MGACTVDERLRLVVAEEVLVPEREPLEAGPRPQHIRRQGRAILLVGEPSPLGLDQLMRRLNWDQRPTSMWAQSDVVSRDVSRDMRCRGLLKRNVPNHAELL